MKRWRDGRERPELHRTFFGFVMLHAGGSYIDSGRFNTIFGRVSSDESCSRLP